MLSSADQGRYVLVVEDDAPTATLIQTLFADRGIPSLVARTGRVALAAIERSLPRLMLLDLGLPGLYGTSLAVTVKTKHPQIDFIVVSGLQVDVVARDAWSIGAAAYLTKPFDCDQLVSVVERTLSAPRRASVRTGDARRPRPIAASKSSRSNGFSMKPMA